jgi:hypothetical protein
MPEQHHKQPPGDERDWQSSNTQNQPSSLHEEDGHAAEKETKDEDDAAQTQSKPKVVLLLISVLMSIFLVALDRTIIATVSHSLFPKQLQSIRYEHVQEDKIH